MILRSLAAYKQRRTLKPDINGLNFYARAPGGRASAVLGQQEQKAPQQIQAAPQQQFGNSDQMNDMMQEMLAMLGTAKIENRRVQEILVPELTMATVGTLLREQLPYSWMASLVTGLRQQAVADPSGQWSQHPLTGLIWRVAYEEFSRNKMGLLSGEPIWYGGPVPQQQRSHTNLSSVRGSETFCGAPNGTEFTVLHMRWSGALVGDCPRRAVGVPGRIQDIGRTPTSKSGTPKYFYLAPYPIL